MPPPNIDINLALSVAQSASPAPPARQRKRQKHSDNISSLPDRQAWKHSDDEIIKADMASLTSDVYGHFTLTLARHTRPIQTANGPTEAPDYIEHVWMCKTNPQHVVRRPRADKGAGTGNFHASISVCHKRCPQSEPTPTTTSTLTSSTYTYAMHLAIIVMSCAYHYLPFARVVDKLFRRQVELLRPGTAVPDSSTVSRTTKFVYQQQARHVKTYFENGVDTIHLAIDGWTSPTAVAYLGLVVHWYAEGRLWRTVLEFIRLEQKHTGLYLAERTAECLKRYGLEAKVRAICLDNASANDRLVDELSELLPGFLGKPSRTRCAAHVINLIVKAFTSHFAQPPTQKRKAAKPAKSQKRRRIDSSQTMAKEAENDADNSVEDALARLEILEL
ncbi:unnamed protein product, partial [Rhizoctonia solani]